MKKIIDIPNEILQELKILAPNGMGICAVHPSETEIKVRHLIMRIAYIPC